MRSVGLIAATMMFVVVSAHGKDVPKLRGAQLAQPPKVDGVLDVGEWDGAALADGFTDPFTNAAPPDNTKVWLAYDNEAIYVAFYAYDSDPSRIVARAVQPGSVPGVGGRGGESITEDVLEFSLDPFNTRQFGMSEFRINARGTTSEMIAGGRSSKREFIGSWAGAATIVSDGWIAEMRIPWSMLNLPRGTGLNMDINFSRSHVRTQINSMWANTTLRRLPELNGIWEGVTPPKTQQKNPLTLLGYIAPEYDEDEDPTFIFRGGADARYDFTSQLTGLLSLSPDFKNIEQEVTSISFTRSERFERDNRPFFTEGSNFFGVGRGGGGGMGDQLFFTRRISDFDQGAKVYGKIDNVTSAGVLFAREDGRRTDGVFNISRVMGDRSSVGFFASMSDDVGVDNQVYSVNARHGQGNYNLNGQYTIADDLGSAETSGQFGLSYSIPKYTASVNYSWVDPDFTPGLGLVRFTDRRGFSFFTNYNTEYRTGPLRAFNVFLAGSNFETFDDHNQQKGVSFRSTATLRSDMGFSLGGETERFEDEEERTVTVGADFNVSNRNKRYGFDYTVGERRNERTEFLSARGSYRFPGRIDAGISHSFLDFEGYTDQTILTVGWEIDERQSLTGRFVRQNGEFNSFVSYSSSGFTGLDWFLIIGDPNAPEWRNRVALKFVWAR